MRKQYAVLIEWAPDAPAKIKLIKKDSKMYKEYIRRRIKRFYYEMHGEEMPAGFSWRKWYRACEKSQYLI